MDLHIVPGVIASHVADAHQQDLRIQGDFGCRVMTYFVNAFMNALGLTKASFLGQSMGGYFSICFAMQYPERVEKLLLIGAPAGMNLWIPLILRLLGTKGLNRFLVNSVGKPGIKNVKNVHKQILSSEETYLR